MKPTRTIITSALLKTLAAVCALAAASASAADATWNVDAASTWVTGGNWSPAAAPGAASPSTTSPDTATFYNVALTVARTVTVDTGRNVKNILFTKSDTGKALTLSGGSLVLSSGGRVELTSTATADVTTLVSSPITLQGSYTFLNNAGTVSPANNLLNFSGAVSGAASLGAITLTLGGTGGSLTGGGKAILQTGVISDGTGNTLSIVKQDAGAWQLNGVNTFSGGVTVKQGALVIGNNGGLSSGGTGAVTLGDNATGQDASISVGSSITVNNPITVASGSGIRMLANNGGSGNGTYSGAITLNHDLTLKDLSASGTRTLTLSGPISGTGNILMSNAAPAAGYTITLSGSVNPTGAITNASTLGDVTISGAIGANVTAVVQNTATSTLNVNSAANAYTGSTIVSAGTLKLNAATASIASSTNITVAAGATFNVSAVTSFSLANGQTLQGAGTVSGAVAGVTGSKISPGGSGTAGTLSFGSTLNISGGGTNLLDVSTSAGSGNDVVAVTGALTIGSGNLLLNALSGAANLDTTSDYVLVTAASITGSFATSPSWVGTPPANAANFTVVTTATQVKLHYTASIPPGVTASANPSTVERGSAFTLTATVTVGSSPISTVTVNLSSIGGSPTASLVLSNNNVYTNTFTVSTGTAVGATSLGVTVTDTGASQGSFSVPLTVAASLKTWNGAGANDDWGTTANWTNNLAPLTGDLVFFAGSTRTSPNLETGYSVAALIFNAGAASFNLGTGNSSTLTVTGGITNNSTSAQTISAPLNTSASQSLRVDAASGNVTVSGSISDSGFGIVKLGANTLTLSAANTYTGPTVVSNGTVAISGAGTLGGGSAGLTLAGNSASVDLGGNSRTVGAVTVAGGTLANGTLTSTSYAFQSGTVSANLAGNVSFTKTTTNILVLSGNNTFSGNFSIPNTSTGICANSSGAFGLGTIDLGSGNGGSFDCTALTAISNANNNAVSISGNFTFIGSQSLNLGTGAANMGSLAKTITVLSNSLEIGGGIFNTSGSSTLTKSGAGTLILSGASTYTGATAVSGGVLRLTGSIGSANTVTVNSGGTLAGSGSISGAVNVPAGGTLAPSGTFPATLTVNNALTVTGTNSFRVSASQSDKVAGVTTFTAGGTLNVSLDSGTLTGGETFTLVQATSYTGTTPTAGTLPSLGGGLNWYLGKMPVNGSITVNRAPTASDLVTSVESGRSVSIVVIGGKLAPTDPDAGDIPNLFVSGVGGAQTLGTASYSATSVTYTSTGGTGSDSFTYTVSDGRGGSVTKTVNVTVLGGNGANIISLTGTVPNITINFAGMPGSTYAIERATVPGGPWSEIAASATTSANGQGSYLDTSAPSPTGYYRTRYVSTP